LAYVPSYSLGVPDSWVGAWEMDYYGELRAERFDPTDPPVFESQASYLKRHGLLMPGENLRIKPAHYSPEILPRKLWPEVE